MTTKATVLQAPIVPPKTNGSATSMKALVYLGDGKKGFVDRPKPQIMAPTDAIVKMVKTTICGTDLHIVKGDVPTAKPGRILGHEGVGIVENVGAGVRAFKPGDHVLISCITADGTCAFCRKLMFSHCVNGGWILGNQIDGTLAEFVRIPYADSSLYPILDGEDEAPLVMCSDILPTGYECGVLNGATRSDSRTRGCRHCRARGSGRPRVQVRRPRSHLVHYRGWNVRVLPQADVLALRERWMDTR